MPCEEELTRNALQDSCEPPVAILKQPISLAISVTTARDPQGRVGPGPGILCRVYHGASKRPSLAVSVIKSDQSLFRGQAVTVPRSVERVQKRASNVLKLTQEHEKLKEELRAMSERLEAAERRRRELDSKMQKQQQKQPAKHS